MTITEFLTARLDEIEAVADRVLLDQGTGDLDSLRAEVLADVAAKRAIVTDVHAEGYDYSASYREPEGTLRTCSECGPDEDVKFRTDGKGYWPCLTLKHLAMPYSEHPDYDEGWRL